MTDRELLLQGILDDPADDAPRLIYADWLEDHGETAHAELIRVQCALARPLKRGQKRIRSQLKCRETELLLLPELNPQGVNRIYWKYRRGFVEEYFLHSPACDAVVKGLRSHLKSSLPPLDKVLSLELCIGGGDPPDEKFIRGISKWEWLRRVTYLHLVDTHFRPASIRALAASPHIRNVTNIFFEGCHMPTEVLPELALAPVIRGVTLTLLQRVFHRGGRGETDSPT